MSGDCRQSPHGWLKIYQFASAEQGGALRFFRAAAKVPLHHIAFLLLGLNPFMAGGQRFWIPPMAVKPPSFFESRACFDKSY